MHQDRVRAAVLTGFGLNCDYETDYSLRLAGAESHRIHINEIIEATRAGKDRGLHHFQILVVGGGFSWADDHGAGVLMASKLRHHMGEALMRFIEEGKLVLGICNGFQTLVNLGLLPAFGCRYDERRAAVTYNDSGNFIDTWVHVTLNPRSPCVFTQGLTSMDLPVRHGEGKFYAHEADVDLLFARDQVVLQYSEPDGTEARGRRPFNPNGSLRDIAGICDPTGRIFGLMPHPEAFNHATNHPLWTRKKEALARERKSDFDGEGDGIRIFRNAVDYVRESL